MPIQIIEVIDLLKREMTAVWAYLHAYIELFEHSDPRRMQLLEKTAPGFFALTQTALIECVLIRLTRLMDPPDSGRSKKNQNLSFGRLFCPCAGSPDLTRAREQFAEICREWNGAKFKPLKDHRNKVHAHNDLPTIKGASPWVTTKLTVNDVQLLKEFFSSLWNVLETANKLLAGADLTEPKYEMLKQVPTAIFPYLAKGFYIEQALSSRPELFDDIADHEFHEVGQDEIMRVLS